MHKEWINDYPLFKECLEALNVDLLPEATSDKISGLFNKMVPMTEWGKVDWDSIAKKKFIGCDPNKIIPALEDFLQKPINKSVYIEWSSGSFPVIEADLDLIVKFFDDVSCVSMEKFIFNPVQGYIIEVRTGDEITVGLLNT